MNKQPFYHAVSILFTATEPITEEEFLAFLKKALKKPILKHTIEIESYAEPEPGDPADLME